MAREIEILFDEKDGRFVMRFKGVPAHEEEHEMLEELKRKLEAQGYEVEFDHYHDSPKLPEVEEEAHQETGKEAR